MRFDVDRINYWLGVGAQPSERVAWLLAKANLIPEPPRRIRPTKSTPRAARGFCTTAVEAPVGGSSVGQPLAAGEAGASFWGTLLELQPDVWASAVAAHGSVITSFR